MSCVQVLVATLSLLVTLVATNPTTVPPTGSEEVDFKTAARQLVKDIRELASQAKNGMAVQSIANAALDLQTDAADLITQLSDEVSQCQTDLVIKTAAAGVGSHEVLTLMLAEDELEALNGRMSLSLVFLERVAQQLEDQLAISRDVGPQLAAVVFGTNATAIIAASADAVGQTMAAVEGSDSNMARRAVVERPDGGAWSLAPDTGLQWRSSVGRATVLLPALAKDGAALKRGGQTSLDLGLTYNKGQGLGVTGSLGHTFNDGKTNVNLGATYNKGQGLGLKGSLGHNFNDKTSVNLGATYNKGQGLGFTGSLGHKFNDKTSVDFGGAYDKGQGLRLGGSLTHEFAKGRGSFQVSPSWSQRGGFGIGGGVSFEF